MTSRDNIFLRHQQSRWLRPDAARWVRPDAARFLKPGTRVADVFPALEQKYSPTQPRIPAGNGRESGRWSNGSQGNRGGASNPIAQPMGDIDFGDMSEIGGLGNLFQITPSDFDLSGSRSLRGTFRKAMCRGSATIKGRRLSRRRFRRKGRKGLLTV